LADDKAAADRLVNTLTDSDSYAGPVHARTLMEWAEVMGLAGWGGLAGSPEVKGSVEVKG
jgi:hypothetical protein